VGVAVVVDRDTGAAQRVQAEGLPYLAAIDKGLLGLT
jgi:orotate phosphoribosyltransferase